MMRILARLLLIAALVVAPRPVLAQQGVAIQSHGNGAELIVCDSSVAVAIVSATTTQVVALTAGKTVFICEVNLQLVGNATPVTFKVVYGTGAACGTGTADLTGVYTGSSNAGTNLQIIIGAGTAGYTIKGLISNAICLTTAGTAGVNGVISYTVI